MPGEGLMRGNPPEKIVAYEILLYPIGVLFICRIQKKKKKETRKDD